MSEKTINKTALKLLKLLHASLLPIHITEDDILEMYGNKAPAFHANFPRINELLLETSGISGEAVLVPATATHKRTGYYTFYRAGQVRMFTAAREPQAGPYFIPDHMRF